MMLAFSVLVVVTAIASASAIFFELDAQLVASKELQLSSETSVRAVRFKDAMDELVRDVRLLAGTPPIQGVVRTVAAGGIDPADGSTDEQWKLRLATIFRQLLRSKPNYLQARYIGVADGGREMVRVERAVGSAKIAAVWGDALQQKGDASYFQATIAREPDGLYVSPIDLNREHGEIQVPHTPVVRASVPVFDAAGAPFGIVIVNFAIGPTLDALTESTNPDDRLFVTNGAGAYLAHPDPQREFEFEVGKSASAAADFPILRRVLEGGENVVVEVREDDVVAVRRVRYGPAGSQHTFAIIAETSLSEATAVSRAVLNRTLLVMAVFVVLALVAGLALARSVARPITSLASAVRSIEDDARRFDPPPGLSAEASELADALSSSFAKIDRHTSELEEKNKELAQFAYIASHDLQEPVRTISSLVSLLVEHHHEQFDGDAKTSLEFLRESTDRMQALIHGLLEYSRLGYGAQAKPTDLSVLLQEVQQDLDAQIKASEATIDVAPLPTLRVLPVEVRLLFQNLLSNALKFRRTDVPLRVSVNAENAGRDWKFCVEDNGIGIDHAHRDRVFLIFQRLHNRGVYEGTGIGLAHCSKIVSMHYGRIWVEDATSGDGVRFCFTLRELREQEAHRS
jgi:signal transduction histidine kinase